MFSPFVSRAGHIACVAAGLLGGGAPWSEVQAASSCTGNLATSLIHPLPSPLTVALQTSVDNAANPALARQFVNGLRQAGVTVSDQGNAMLSLTVTLVPSAAAAGAARAVGGTYKGFDWNSGEQAPTPGQGPSIQSANLSMSVTLTDNAQSTLSWVATLQCKVQTTGSTTLAEFMGEVIGRSLGKNIDRKAF